MLNQATPYRRQCGLSIIELLVGIAIGLIVVAGGSALYLSTSENSITSQRQFRLNQEVRAVMDIMLQDIRRAGYWSNAVINSTSLNPMMTATTDLYVTPANYCWLYTYDATFSPSHTAGTPSFFGFRLNNNTIETLPENTALTDTSSNCNNVTEWTTLTDPSTVNIRTITPSISYKCLSTANIPSTPGSTHCNSGDVEIRQFTLSVNATHTQDPNITISLTDSVTLPNNRIVP